MELKFKKKENVEVSAPRRATPYSAGIDFYLPEILKDRVVGHNCSIINDHTLLIGQQGDVLIGLGIYIKLPVGHSLLFVNKSGIARKNKLVIGSCLIDEDYQGELKVHLINYSTEAKWLFGGRNIIQGIIIPTYSSTNIVEELDELYETKTIRGDGGFGSTGV